MTRIASILALVAAIFVAYAPVRDAEFLNYDDNEYVYANPDVVGGLTAEGVDWAFTEAHSSNWHPLTWIAHMIDVELFGAEPGDAGQHHLANVFMHALATALLAWLGFVLTGHWWASLFVAALFGLHPLHVESVAWISERKDTLSATLGFAALIAFVSYTRRGGKLRYLAVTVLLALGLMAKPILVTLPLAMMILEFWPLRPGGRPTARFVEKLPWIGLAIASGLATIAAQSVGPAVKSVAAIPMADRVVNAIHATLAYVGKLVAPLDLAVIYPHWATSRSLSGPSAGQTAVELFLLIAITTAAILLWRRREERMALASWVLWLLLLAPVIGILQVGDQAMADRYTYLPSIALFALPAGALTRLVRLDPRSRVPAVSIAMLLLIACSIGTWQRTQVWQNSETLFRNAVAVNPASANAHLNLGHALARSGNAEEARRHYAIATQLRPGDALAHFNLANNLRDAGQLDEAAREYEAALRADDSNAAAANNLGDLLARQGRFDEAIAWFHRALAINPDLGAARTNLARALLVTNRLAESAEVWRRVLTDQPDNAAAWDGLAQASLADSPADGVAAARHAVELADDNPEFTETLARALGTSGAQEEAMTTMRRARDLYRAAGREADAARVQNTLQILEAAQ
jgi:tetratricopeptide (TPR) repeat protein